MDLASLSTLYAADGPFVSIYLDTTSAVENASARLETRWKNVLRELDQAGVDGATKDALTAVHGEHDRGGARVLVASHGTVHLATWLPEPPPRDLVRVDPLPHLLPLVDSLALRIPHVVVLTDREGADVLAYTTTQEPVAQASLETKIWPIHHTGVGGWSSKRYDNTVRNSWEESAREVATLVDNVCRDIGAEIVIASGDTRALALLEEQLPESLRAELTTIDGGGRHLDGSDDVVAEQVVRALADHVARRTLQTLTRFAQARGQGDNASDGVAETVRALRMGQVDTLLLTDTFDRTQRGWFGPEAVHLGLARGDLEDMGVREPGEAELGDILLRAATGTAAEVRLVTGGVEESPSDGVGALLRFPAAEGTES